ncbi:hypothetical protein BIY37_12215 [Candidatus Brocadia sapporoensis]|uniref:Uncharacterized protein n=1 Tax=Candidatus Brocadia sapporoensis TaxID=392547 RepID=A0A1V6LXB4_9BACT|nr:hypothetical protein [Candidatus Brocadia sapporoensis]OQD44773.1 hypothetical protein BIY37_12215 [Candidatus Brocadia sapporoensis]GJQ23063.1 MAG: hypothetical protein HBSAPP01_08530 [Candidatus Brocadia sapporoensis]
MHKAKFQNRRIFSLMVVHFYILLHFSLWYGVGVKIWGKTAMMGVPSLLAGHFVAGHVIYEVL